MILFLAVVVLLLVRISEASAPLNNEFFPHSTEEEIRLRQLVDEINAKGLPWKAEYNPFASLKNLPAPEEDINADYSELKLDGLSIEESRAAQYVQDTEHHLRELASHTIDLPSYFDAREKWAGCFSVHHIQNQGGCGSCWAAAATAMLSDRLCISSNFTEQQLISAQDVVSCCAFCGGCAGSFSLDPLLYWKMHGIVSGGPFGSTEGCQPYGISASCGTPCPPYFYQQKFTPACEKRCQPQFQGDYQADLRKGRSIYHIVVPKAFEKHSIFGIVAEKYADTMRAVNVSATDLLKRELVLYGPVSIAVELTEPFMHYRSGIYTGARTNTTQDSALNYGHVMKLLGWGEEAGEKYWIVANSWGKHWGEGGFARVSMDYFCTENCMIAVAGLW